MTYPATFSFISETNRSRLQGAAFGMIFGFQLIGGTLGVLGAGVLAQASGSPAAPFLLVAVVCGAGLIYLLGVRSRADILGRESPVAASQL